MPRQPIDFSKTIIYKIICKDINITDCYVGQTTDFKTRKSKHKFCCNNINNKHHNLYIYKFIREHYGWNNWNMIEIEKFPCKDIFEATKQERIRTEELKATLNSNVPSRTQQQHYEDNKEHFLLYRKNYYKQNYENIFKQVANYKAEHKEQISEYQKKYWEENKETILKYKKEVYTCYCGSICRKDTKKRHEQTNKHIQFVEQKLMSLEDKH